MRKLAYCFEILSKEKNNILINSSSVMIQRNCEEVRMDSIM